MRKRLLPLFIILLLCLIFISTKKVVASENKTTFTPDELAWIKAHPEINLVINIGPAPINFWEGAEALNAKGPRPGERFRPPPGERFVPPPQKGFRPPPEQRFGPPGRGSNKPLVKIEKEQANKFKGVASEYLKEIEKITGLHFVPVLLSYQNFRAAFKAIEDGEADLIPMMQTAEPLPRGLILTEPYIQIPVVVVMSEKSSGYTNFEQLSTLQLAGVLPIQHKLNQMGLKTSLIHTSPTRGLIGVSTGEFDAFIGELSAISHVLTTTPVTQIKIVGELPLPSNIAMGVSSRIKELVPIFNKALTIVSSNRKAAIHEKWFKMTYEKKIKYGPWVWFAMIIGSFILISGLLYLVHYKRRLKQIQTAVDALDPHLLSANIDRNIIITQVTEALCKITGFKTQDLIGKPLLALGSPADDHPNAMDVLWQTIKEGDSWKGEVKIQKKDGSTLWTEAIVSPLRRESENSDGYTVIYQDVSQQKHYENLAIRDELTKLYNRRHFNTLAPELLKRSKEEKKILTLILMDVDNFKKYNDTYGHPEGDKVLTAIGESLNLIFKRRSDLAFRLGGEEFGALALVSSPEEAKTITQTTRQHIQDLAVIHELNPPGVVTISMGLITLNPEEDSDIDTLYKKADEALYKAKQNGRNQYVYSN